MYLTKSFLKKIKAAQKNKILIFTGGVFDLFHKGHLHYLNKAKKCGDILVVQVDSDSSVYKRKRKKPIFDEKSRYEIIASLKFIDYAFISDIPSGSIQQIYNICPDILVRIDRQERGKNYKQLKSKELLKHFPNLKIKFFQPTPTISTTQIISLLQQAYQNMVIEQPKHLLSKIVKKILLNGYSYSGYKVASAVYAGNKVYSGVNISNASPALAICAERFAIMNAILNGEKYIKEIVIMSNTNTFPYPCGLCRQIIYEFMPPKLQDIPIYLINGDGKELTTSIKRLFPDPFITIRKHHRSK